MTMRTAIERDGTSTTDAYGHGGVPAFATLATVPCRVWSRSRAELVEGRKSGLIEELRCAMPLGTDVTAKDRLASVTDRKTSPTTLWAGPLRILAIQHKHTHIEMNLEKVST